MSRSLVLLCAALGTFACARKDPAPRGPGSSAPTAVILLSSDVRGYLGPCGCSANMQGGIDRAVHVVEQARAEGAPLIYFDAGNSLYADPRILPQSVPEEDRKAQALAEAFRLMGAVTKLVGKFDEARGAEVRQRLGLPDQQPGTVKVVPAGEVQVGIAYSEELAGLPKLADAARAQGAAFVVGVVQQRLEPAQKARREHGVDLVIANWSPGWFEAEENKLIRNEVPVAQVQSKGRSLLRIDLSLGGGVGLPFTLRRSGADLERELSALAIRIEDLRAQTNDPLLSAAAQAVRQEKLEELLARRERLARTTEELPAGKNSFALRFVVLESTLPGDPRAQALVADFDRDVAKLNVEWARAHGEDCPPPERGQAAFVGNASCEECHAEAFPVWKATKHAHGYETLEHLGKQFHLDCVGCHVTGFLQPGGVCRVDKVEQRKGVGCESCHGPGSLHAEDPGPTNIKRSPPESDCVGCHNPENSPHFDFAKYLPRVLGKGHGDARARGSE